MKKIIIFFAAILAGVVFFICTINTAKAVSTPNQIIGGGCAYDEFDGLCKVLNLYFNPEKASTKLVRFRFQPDISLSSASFDLLKNSNMIDTDQERTLDEVVPNDWKKSDKNKVEIGDILSCKLKIENSGTCTPIIFSFLDIQNNPSAYDDMALKQTIAEMVFLLLPILIIIIVFIVKYEKFVHRFNKVRQRKRKK